jgi:lipooligosaccharide transport system permease protein
MSAVFVGAMRSVEWHWTFYRREWRANLASSFLQPVLYLLALGVGVGSLVERGDGADAIGGSYVAFLGPALLATTAMLLASGESLWPVMSSFRWSRAFHAAVATRVGATDLALGHALWLMFRGALAASMVSVALVLFPDTRSWGLVAALPVAALCGAACGMPMAAFAATRDVDSSFSAIQRFVVTPLFLFAGVFYPLGELPQGLQVIGWVTPLWHGVEVCRGAVTGGLDVWRAVGHVAVMALWAGVATVWAARTFARRLNA